MKFVLCVLLCLGGAGGGAIAGRYLAHNSPLFGGINMMGQPGSPARESLVPGHMAVLGSAGGAIGLAIGALIVVASRPRTNSPMRSRRNLPKFIDIPK